MSGALSSPFNEAPCTQAAPPTAIDVLPASTTSLLVAFPPSEDDGGKPITNYKVEWDAIGLEGYRNGGSSLDSLLYSDVDVQAVEVSGSKNDVGGSFFLSYRYDLEQCLPVICTSCRYCHASECCFCSCFCMWKTSRYVACHLRTSSAHTL